MVGTAGLPHVIVRFFTVKKVSDARKSAGWALLFIGILYTTAPAIAVFARTNLIETVSEKRYDDLPGWFDNWEKTGLLTFEDKNKHCSSGTTWIAQFQVYVAFGSPWM